MKSTVLLFIFAFISIVQAQSDPLSLTKANLKGHKRLYHEGYSIIPSTEKSLEYIYQKSLIESGKSILQAQQGIHHTGQSLKDAPAELYQGANELGGTILQGGTKGNRKLVEALKIKSKVHRQLSKAQISKAWEELVIGHREIIPREKSSWSDLKNYLNSNFQLSASELDDLDRWLWSDGANFTKAKNAWGDALLRAQEEFEQSYQKSGERENSFIALGDILWGYGKAIYYGLFRPSGTQISSAIKIGAKVLTHSLIGTAVVTKNIFLTTGRVFYFIAETGYYIIAPSAKASIYATLSLFNSASSLMLEGTAPGLYVANQVALSTVATASGATYFTVGMTGEVLKDTALFTYHLAKGVGGIALNQGKSAISLGHNLITALPAQMAMGVGTATLFLAWDGPRLVLYSFKHRDHMLLPKDVVVDQEKAKSKGTWTEVTDDPKIIDGLLDQLNQEETNK